MFAVLSIVICFIGTVLVAGVDGSLSLEKTDVIWHGMGTTCGTILCFYHFIRKEFSIRAPMR